MKGKKIIRNGLSLLALPVTVYVFFLLICRMAGSTTFGVGTDFTNIVVTTIYTGFISLALSYNLTSGRFDFSIGSVMILSNVIGYQLTLALGWGAFGSAILCLLAGLVLGFFSGIAYVVLKLPPMVCSLGVAMIYEAIAFIITDGAGVKLIGRNDLLVFAQGPAVFLLLAVILVVLIILLNFTVFGFNCRSLRSGQEIGVSVGINEKKNSVACYMLAGTLMAAAGLINTSRLGIVSVSTGLGSSSVLMNAFLPMFIGVAFAKFGERNIGVILGSFAQACMISAFGTGKLNFSPNLQTVLSGLVVMIFLFVTNNSYQLEEMKRIKVRRAQALEQQGKAH